MMAYRRRFPSKRRRAAVFAVFAALVLFMIEPEAARAQDCSELTADGTVREVSFTGGISDDVCWRISAPPGLHAVVDFQSISVQRNFDYLTARRSRGQTTAYVRAPVLLADDDYVYVGFKSDDSVSSGGFTFNYFATDAPGSCGDGVVSALEACDPALSPACRFDCTTTSADNVVRSNSGTYACDLVYATNNETASITYEPIKNTAKCWLFIPDTDVVDAAMRVNITIGDLQACCDHVWVNGMLYVPNTNLVFGGTEPVEVRFRSVAANVTGDITMEYSAVPIGEIGECGDGTVGPTESCDDGHAGGCSEVCQGYATAPECELDTCSIGRDHPADDYHETDGPDDFPRRTACVLTDDSVIVWNLADSAYRGTYLRLRYSYLYLGFGDSYLAVVVNGQVVRVHYAGIDLKDAFPDADDIVIVLVSASKRTDALFYVDVCTYNGECDDLHRLGLWWLLIALGGFVLVVFVVLIFNMIRDWCRERIHASSVKAARAAKAKARAKERRSSSSLSDGSDVDSDDSDDSDPSARSLASGSRLDHDDDDDDDDDDSG